MGFLNEFKAFALRGNIVDLAVGVVIGTAFGKIVSSLVDNIITPVIGLLIGGVKFDSLKVMLADGNGTTPPVTLNYGSFFQSVFDFAIIAFVIFVALRGLMAMKKKEVIANATPPEVTADVRLLTEIRDLLSAQKTK